MTNRRGWDRTADAARAERAVGTRAPALVLGVSLFALAACGAPGGPSEPGARSGSTSEGEEPGTDATCVEGDTSECSVGFDKANGAHACRPGERTCDQGQWSACRPLDDNGIDPADSLRAPLGGTRVAALGTVINDCGPTSTCEPDCHTFDETPPHLIALGGGMLPGRGEVPDDWEKPYETEPCESGLDCQINSRCDDVATDASCAHSKCSDGPALVAGCDPCVTRICSAPPECCTSDGNPVTNDWSAACVHYVKTLCDADCGPESAGCGHDMCSTGSALDDSCHSCALEVCGTPGFEYCCDGAGIWDADCVTAAKRFCSDPSSVVVGAGTNRCDYALMANGNLVVYGAAIKGGDVGGGTGSNMVSTVFGEKPLLTGSIYSTGPINIVGSSINKDAKAVGPIAGCSDLVAGTCTQYTTVPTASIPKKTLTCASGTQTIATNTTLSPGDYGSVTVNAGVTVTFQPGAYTMASLTVNDNGKLGLPASGAVYLDVCGAVTTKSGVTTTGASVAGDALRFNVYTNGNVKIGAGNRLYATFTAPNGTGTLDQATSAKRTVLYGFLHANVSSVNAYTEINATGISGRACADAVLDVPSTCPVVTPTSGDPPGTGQCIENALGHIDDVCTGVDLAMGFGCDTSIEVCNHGQADAPAGTEVAFYERSSLEFATDAPNEAYRVGTCTITSPILAGGCVEQDCDASLTNADAYVMVNPPTSSGSECSRLDNWTYHDASQNCLGTPTFVTSIHRYEATCPDGQSPLWGLLTWDTTTPGASTVTWSARTAFTETGLSDETWVDVGVSMSSSDPTLDTQLCELGSAAEACPVDLTEALELGWIQGQFLELKIFLAPDGSDAPEATDWEINYNCVDDV